MEQIQKAAEDNRRSVLFPYSHEFDSYFVGLQPIESDTIASEIAAVSDDLAKKIRDDLGKKGIEIAALYIPAWAEDLAEDVLANAGDTVIDKVIATMKKQLQSMGLSPLTVARSRPSGEKARLQTVLVWPESVAFSPPVATSSCLLRVKTITSCSRIELRA